jgi:hypothetical protein
MDAIKRCCPQCLRALQPIFETDFPSDHGLHKVLNLNVLNRLRASQLKTHLFTLFMLLKDDLSLAHTMAQAYFLRLGSPTQEIPAWVNQSAYDTFFFNFLAEFHPWLEDELTLILRSIVRDNGLLAIQTCAPDQLLTEWYITKFRAAMDILEAEHEDHPPVDREPFVQLHAIGQKLLAGTLKLQVPFGTPMPEELRPFCSSQSLVLRAEGLPTTE